MDQSLKSWVLPLEWQEGETSAVVEGDGGVYIIRVDNIVPADENANLDILRDQIARGYNTRVDYEVFEALKEKVAW